MNCERSVASANHEFDIRGATEIKAVSSALVKNKSYDLIELCPLDAYKDFKPAVKTIDKLLSDWREKQIELEHSGLNKK